MKLWIDDKQSAPSGYTWCRRIEDAKDIIGRCLMFGLMDIEVIDICKEFGKGTECADFIRWMQEMRYNAKELRIHSIHKEGAE